MFVCKSVHAQALIVFASCIQRLLVIEWLTIMEAYEMAIHMPG